MVTPHWLKDIEILTIIPEYDEGQFSSIIVVSELGKQVRVKPMLNLSTEIPYLELEELEVEKE